MNIQNQGTYGSIGSLGSYYSSTQGESIYIIQFFKSELGQIQRVTFSALQENKGKPHKGKNDVESKTITLFFPKKIKTKDMSIFDFLIKNLKDTINLHISKNGKNGYSDICAGYKEYQYKIQWAVDSILVFLTCLEQKLSKNKITPSDLDKVLEAFIRALSSCQDYLDNKINCVPNLYS